MGSDLKKRAIILLAIILVAILFLLPTIFKGSIKSWVSKPLALGLDLSGGVHLVYEVEAKEAVKSRLQSIANTLKPELRDIKAPAIRTKITDQNRLEFTFLNEQSAEKAQMKITDDNKDLQFVEKAPDGEKTKLIYGISDTFASRVESEAINQAVETLRNRVDQFGVTEPLIQKIGSSRILLQMPGVSDVQSVKKVVGSVAKLEFRFLPSPGKNEGQQTLKNRKGEPIVVEDEVGMTGDSVQDARVNIEGGQVEVSLRLTSEGGKRFGQLTSANVGRNLAIILDNVVYSSPTIREAILGGTASISGGFSLEEAKQLAVVLRAGALPAPLKVVEERNVGPTLGAESIKKGVFAIIGGFVLIAIFMVIWYKKSGLVAVASLILNLIFILAVLSAFGATLTLPGLAALALTIGVAVDSNVIIFERIKDEIATGAGRDSSVRGGFEKAFTAIFDANLAAFFTGIILYFLGTGPIKGFAVSLCVGIVTTVFCAVFAARIAFDYFELKGPKGLSI